MAKWILELDRGRGIPFEGNYSSWLEQKQERLAREEKGNEARQRTLERELEWVRMSPKARQAKGKARLTAYDKLQQEAEAAERGPDKLEITIPVGKRLGDTVIEVQNLRKGFGDRLLIEDLSFSLPKAGIVGIIGPNGAGKTTLFKMLTGQEAPDSGTITVGDTVELAYVDQSRDALDPDATVYEEITGGVEHMKVGNREIHGRAYCASFNFKGSDQQKRVGDLSGGERNRVHLAKVLKTGGNVLLLDEPTNDLDVDTLRALEIGARQLPRLRRGHQPRSLVPRPHRHPRAGVRGRQPGALVRGQLQRVRGLAPQGARLRRPTSRTASSTSRWPAERWRGAGSPESCAAVFVAGIAGLIVSSVAGNNAGVVLLSIGLAIVFAAVALLTYGAVTPKQRIDAFDEARAEQLEEQVAALVAAGAAGRSGARARCATRCGSARR